MRERKNRIARRRRTRKSKSKRRFLIKHRVSRNANPSAAGGPRRELITTIMFYTFFLLSRRQIFGQKLFFPIFIIICPRCFPVTNVPHRETFLLVMSNGRKRRFCQNHVPCTIERETKFGNSFGCGVGYIIIFLLILEIRFLVFFAILGPAQLKNSEITASLKTRFTTTPPPH